MEESPERPRLLLVEDERHLAAGIKLNFELEGYDVDAVDSAREAAAHLLDTGPYDAILLDVMLPDSSGFDLCQRLRDAGDHTPVLMLTALGNTEDRVRGLEAGADDYLVKPFELSELLARVRSMLRRSHWSRETAPSSVRESVRIGEAEVDFAAREVRRGDEAIHLTSLEFDLLSYLIDNAGRVLSRQELQANVWKLDNYPDTRSTDNKIMRLRKIFESDPTSPRYFVSVRGAGYKYVPDTR